MKRALMIAMAALAAIACSPKGPSKDLLRQEPSEALAAAFQTFQDSVAATMTDSLDIMKMVNLHSIMVVKDGKVVLEKSFNDRWPGEAPHPLFSVSKTFTSAAVGLAISEGKLSLDAPVASFFPDKVREDNPCGATVRDLLMMAGGHAVDPTGQVGTADPMAMKITLENGVDIAQVFFDNPFVHDPGKQFCYNSLGTYILSSIVTKVTGESVLDYLTPRLFTPLGIDKPVWDADLTGVSLGGWGLYLKTEDLAKMGLLLLQKGKWNGTEVLPETWVEAMSRKQLDCLPAGMTQEQLAALGIPAERNDWIQGYGYQMWRNSVDGFRADGAYGQFILVLPQKNAVIAITAQQADTQKELWYVWDYLYPAL